MSQSGVFLILLGSSIDMMETEVLGHKSPLFGRRTGQILVEPLSFNSAKEFFPAMSDDAFMCNRVGRWWSKEGEIDIMGLAEKDRSQQYPHREASKLRCPFR